MSTQIIYSYKLRFKNLAPVKHCEIPFSWSSQDTFKWESWRLGVKSKRLGCHTVDLYGQLSWLALLPHELPKCSTELLYFPSSTPNINQDYRQSYLHQQPHCQRTIGTPSKSSGSRDGSGSKGNTCSGWNQPLYICSPKPPWWLWQHQNYSDSTPESLSDCQCHSYSAF